jgi:hypothetical protein
MPWVLQPALVALRTWSRRAEITCDRAGMLVAKGRSRGRARHHQARRRIAQALRRVQPRRVPRAARGRKEGIGKYMEVFATHPWLPKRVLAMRVFGESELYRKAVGGPARGLTMSEVDSRVARCSRETRDELDQRDAIPALDAFFERRDEVVARALRADRRRRLARDQDAARTGRSRSRPQARRGSLSPRRRR